MLKHDDSISADCQSDASEMIDCAENMEFNAKKSGLKIDR